MSTPSDTAFPRAAEGRGERCPPLLHLEQASAGDWLPGVQMHVDGCASCTAQVKALQTMAAEFVAARPVERFLQQLETRKSQPEKPRSRFALVAIAASLSVLVLFTIVQAVPRETGVTMKGGLARITLKRGKNITSLSADSKLAPGDALRFSVVAPSEGYAVVLERDSTGKVTVVAPFGAKEPKAVNAGTNVLPDSAVLDGVRGQETFVTVFSAKPFDVQQAVEAIERRQGISCECFVEESTFDKP